MSHAQNKVIEPIDIPGNPFTIIKATTTKATHMCRNVFKPPVLRSPDNGVLPTTASPITLTWPTSERLAFFSFSDHSSATVTSTKDANGREIIGKFVDDPSVEVSTHMLD